MADYFANTLTIEIPGVWKAKRYFAADHTYWQTGDDGEVKGTWAIEDGKVCTVQVPGQALSPPEILQHRRRQTCRRRLGRPRPHERQPHHLRSRRKGVTESE
jgi:hypothetical protein